MNSVTALVLAGARPGVDPFAEANGTDLKALIPVGGVPMVRRPVEALLGSGLVGEVRVVAQQPERISAALPQHAKLTVARSAGSIAATLEAICSDPGTRWPLLVTTADHALLDGAMIDEFCAGAKAAELAVGVVERRTLLRRFPDARRTWIAFRGGAYSGANLFWLAGPNVLPAIRLWSSAEQERKSGRRLLGILGPLVILGTALRLLSLDQVLDRVGRRLGIAVRAVELTDPLAAVDVDKQSDLELAEMILAGGA